MSNIKIFKLVNGDEIIGSILESSDENSIKVEKPMIFKTSTMIDNKGYPYDLTILKDWLTRTDNKIAEISKTQISTSFSPNENTIKLYNLELMKSESDPVDEILTGKDMLDKMNPINSFDEILESFMDNVNNIIESPEMKPRKKAKKRRRPPPPEVEDATLSSMIPDELKERPMIYLSMVIPPEAIMNLISAGILDPDQLLLMIEEVKKKNKFTGDEKKREDFGNKFSDWNPDPNSKDYE
jgi:hypothetical protein